MKILSKSGAIIKIRYVLDLWILVGLKLMEVSRSVIELGVQLSLKVEAKISRNLSVVMIIKKDLWIRKFVEGFSELPRINFEFLYGSLMLVICMKASNNRRSSKSR